jgi:hypothetical protein
VADDALADTEVAWAGAVTIARTASDAAVIYRVAHLQRLVATEPSASLCPISPEQLTELLGNDAPLVFVHTHITGEGDSESGASDRRLACSQDDLRCFHRLPVGSLGVVAASRRPLRVRVYGWPANGDELAEMTAAVTVATDL